MLGFLSKLFRPAVEIVEVEESSTVKLCYRQDALLALFRNERNDHHVSMYLYDLDPRNTCTKEIMQELAIFLACKGNSLEVFILSGELERYQTHRFADFIQDHPSATLSVIPDRLMHPGDIMAGSHGQTYSSTFETRDGYFIEDNELELIELSGWFNQLRQSATLVRPAPAP